MEIKLTAKDQIVRQEFIIDIENGDLKKLNEVGLIDLNGDGTVSLQTVILLVDESLHPVKIPAIIITINIFFIYDPLRLLYSSIM